jgi:ATP-binding cassette, subfamily B, bacterial
MSRNKQDSTHLDEMEVDTRPLDFALIRRAWSYTRAHKKKRNGIILMAFLRSIQLPSLGWVVSLIISGPIAHHDIRGTLYGVAGFIALVLFTEFILHYRVRIALELGEAVVHDLRNEIFRHLQRMPMSFFNKTKLGRLISRITSDSEAVRMGIQNVLFITIVQVGQLLVAGMLMLYYDWILFSVVLAMSPFLWKLNQHFRFRLSDATRAMQESYSKVTSTLAESVNGIRVTQGFVREDANAEIFRKLIVDLSNSYMNFARSSAVFLPMLELNTQVFISALLVVGGYRVLHPGMGMDVANLIRFFFLANLFFDPVRSIGALYHQALTSMAGAERVFKFLDTKPDWQDAETARELPSLQGVVEFKRVVFEYTPGRPVLHDVSFIARPGETIALVGHTGSGKSSIINLVAKFYLPTKGEIFIDQIEIRQIQSRSLSRHLGIVLQQNFLFTGSLLDNIRVGRPQATDDEIVQVVREMDCFEFFEELPQGLKTLVGEKGGNLSLGQRQLVCFARAMLADPRIIILDEATSSVDTLTEVRIQNALKKLLQGRTSFVIAHRLSTIREANLILVLEQGNIVERGTHFELLEKKGHYYQLYRQFFQLGTAPVTA